MQTNPLGLALLLFLLLIAIEWMVDRRRRTGFYRATDTVSSLSMGLTLLSLDVIVKLFTFSVFIYIWQYWRLFDFAADDPLTWVIFFFGVDFCYYWFHRLAHEINFLWGAHVGHHQSEDYTLATALRQSAFQYSFSWVFYLPLAFFGCPPEVFLMQFALLKLYQFWLHTRHIKKLPLIEGILSTPSSHRVHHARNAIYVDRNYGGTLLIWDRLFNTFQPELADVPCEYGTLKPIDRFDVLSANLDHWRYLASACAHTASWKDKLGVWFARTGWLPDDCQHMTSVGKDTAIGHYYDPHIPEGAKYYAMAATLLLFSLAAFFIYLSPDLSWAMRLSGVTLLLWSVITLSRIADHGRPNKVIEVTRWAIISVYGYFLVVGDL